MKTLLKISFIISLFFGSISCEKDEPEELNNKSISVEKANTLLTDDIILSTKAFISGRDVTLLPNGCPVKYTFNWQKNKEQLRLIIESFRVGNMPLTITFIAHAKYMELNNWEKEEYPEKGWVKFYAEDGSIAAVPEPGQPDPVSDGAGIVKGYINPLTEEIEFAINYNMMNVTTHTFRQKIDKNRLKTFKEDFEQYEKDLKKYKEENGL